MIATNALSKVYQTGEEKVFALEDFNVEITQGEFIAVIGKSGSGKSTLLHILGGLLSPTSGSVSVDKEKLEQKTENELAIYRNRYVGFIFQSFHLQEHLTALENVCLPLKIRGEKIKERENRALAILKEVGLEKRVHHLPKELSGGEKQRVAIARAIVGQPKLLLADEPTGNLDSKTGEQVMEILRKLHREKLLTIILITHDPQVASQADRVVHLHDGQLVSDKKSPQTPLE